MKEGIYLLAEDLMADLDHSLITGEHDVSKGFRGLKVETTERGHIITDSVTGQKYQLIAYEKDVLHQLDVIWGIQMSHYMAEMRMKEEKEKKDEID